ncbi:MAG TPA: hypothetical protein PLB55_06470, partial [Prosthecobacter sp.]|nr:hypothetical protein [Prosthecobacter sp.]
RAVLLGCLVFLYVGNVFGGFSLFWVFLGVSLNRLSMTIIRPRPAIQPDQYAAPWGVQHSALG